MRPRKHQITLNGKDYILFAGLLDEAHRQGLMSIKTNLIKSPTKETPMAVVSAEVITEKGTFQGLGDASPDSVNEFIAPHLIRMAETRAVARAFRFATNVAMTAFEELGRNGMNGTVATGSTGTTRIHTPQLVNKPSMTQEEYVRMLCKDRDVHTDLEQEVIALWDYKQKHDDWPVHNASIVIDKLKACPKKVGAA